MNNFQKIQIMEELLTSSSSDDEEINYYLLCIPGNEAVPKIKTFMEDVIHELTDKEFRKNFRLSRSSLNILLSQYETSNIYRNRKTWLRGTKITPAEKEVLIFVWFAANHTSLRDVSQRFGIALSTCHKVIEKVMDFIVEIAPKYIKFPESPEEKEQMSRNFYTVSNFPSILGCIDGTSIPVVMPAKKVKSTYVNRHDTPSITLQGICDYKKCFIDVFTGAPGKIHDCRVFKLSDISQKLPNICEKNYHLLGDSAYHIREWLLTPYRDYGQLTEGERLFNKKFCATRVLIENTFGLLKARFRQLTKVHMHDVPKICKFIISCCVLHNLCILNEDDLEEETHSENIDDSVELVMDTENKLRKLGETKRNFLKDSFLFN